MWREGGEGAGEETEEAISNHTTPLPALSRCRFPQPFPAAPPDAHRRLQPGSLRAPAVSRPRRTIAAGSMTLSLRAENPRWLLVDFSSPVAPACLLTCAWWPSPPTTYQTSQVLRRFEDLGLSHTVSVPGDAAAFDPPLLPI